jgi:hypothetical protein
MVALTCLKQSAQPQVEVGETRKETLKWHMPRHVYSAQPVEDSANATCNSGRLRPQHLQNTKAVVGIRKPIAPSVKSIATAKTNHPALRARTAWATKTVFRTPTTYNAIPTRHTSTLAESGKVPTTITTATATATLKGAIQKWTVPGRADGMQC